MADFDSNRFASASVEWGTPQDLFDAVNEEFCFTLDVAASGDNAKCARFFTKDDDGLSQPWSGVCWVNPPYGRQMIRWLEKARREKANGVTTVALIPARTNTGWFHEICLKEEVRFIRGRPKFNGAAHGLPQPLALVIFRAV